MTVVVRDVVVVRVVKADKLSIAAQFCTKYFTRAVKEQQLPQPRVASALACLSFRCQSSCHIVSARGSNHRSPTPSSPDEIVSAGGEE